MRIMTPTGFGPEVMTPNSYGDSLTTAAILDQTVTINADVAAVPVTFWTASSGNALAGAYMIVVFFEIVSTSLNAGCGLNPDFTIDGTANSTPVAFAAGAGPLDALVADASYNNSLLDNGTAVQWSYGVTGYVSGTAQVRFKTSILRLA